MTIAFGRTAALPYSNRIIGGTWSTTIPTTNMVSGMAVGDSLVFTSDTASGGPFGSITINLTAAVSGTTFTGVWEYAQKVGNSNTVITWAALTGVTDGTNGLTTAGTNTVSFTVPADWTNWVVLTGNAYRWHIRFRITGYAGITNNGSYSTLTCAWPSVQLTGTQSLTMEDIYTASVAGGWGAVTKTADGSYLISKVIEARASTITFTSKNELLTFGRNAWINMLSGAVAIYGEVDANGIDRKGSTLQFNSYGADYSGVNVITTNGTMRDTVIKVVLQGGFTSGNGLWGGAIGQDAGQTISSVELVDFRSLQFSNAANILKNVKSIGTYSNAHVEPLGATIIGFMAQGSMAFRHQASSGAYSHRSDASKIPSYPVNVYQAAGANSRWYHVDMLHNSALSKDSRVYWTSGGASANWGTCRVEMVSSVVLTVSDGANPVSSATVAVINNANAVALSLTSNADGYATAQEIVAATGTTASSITAASATGGALRFSEIIMTSGAVAGQRSVIHADSGTVLTLAESFSAAPAVGTRGVIVPYVSYDYHNGPQPIANGYGTRVAQGPFSIRARKYGYLTQTIGSALTSASAFAMTLLADSAIQQSTQATVAAYTGITIDHGSQTITLSADHTIRELYDYCQYNLLANMTYSQFFTSSDAINFASAYNLVLSAALTGSGALNLGSKTLTVSGGSSTLPITHSTGVLTSINITGLVSGSRVQVYDLSSSTELYNATGGTSVTIPVTWTTNHTIRVRANYSAGVSAYLPFEQTGLLTASGMTVVAAQVVDTVYNANAVDGSTVTEFTADYPNVQIDINDVDGTTSPQRCYAWYVFNQMSAAGIAAYFGAITAEDAENYRINTAIANMRAQNVGTNAVIVAGARVYRDDGASIFAPGNGPVQLESGKAYLASSTATKVDEIHGRLGLTQGAPLATSADLISFGGVNLAVVESSGVVTVTRA